MGLIIDISLVALVAVALFTQVIVPLVTESRLFPAFSKKSLELVDELAEVDQELAAEHLRHELARKRQILEKEQHGHQPPDAA